MKLENMLKKDLVALVKKQEEQIKAPNAPGMVTIPESQAQSIEALSAQNQTLKGKLARAEAELLKSLHTVNVLFAAVESSEPK